MEKFKNLYEVRKTIRFNLLPVKHNYKKITDGQFKSDLKSFLKKYKQVVDNLSELVFIQNEDDDQILNENTRVSIAWLKEYEKQEFHKNKEKLVKRNKRGNKTGNYVSLRDTDFLLEKFQLWILRNWQEKNEEGKKIGILNNLEILSGQPLESQERNADFAYHIHQIYRRTNFEFIYEFFKNAQGAKSDALIIEIIPVLEDCKNLLKNLENYLRPKQSFGHVIEQSSLNYYTVNKKPKDYPREIKKWEEKKDEKYLSLSFYDSNVGKKKNFFFPDDFQSHLENLIESLNEEKNDEKKIKKEFGDISEINNWKLEQTYKNFKLYKAKQKSQFYEYVYQILEKYDADSEYVFFESHLQDIPTPLFANITDDKFKNLVEESKIIRDKSTKYNNSKDKKLKEAIISLKKKRGDTYFNVQNKPCPFSRYETFCGLFKEIAMTYGKIKAEVRSLEKEQIEAERLQSWAILLEKENQHYVMTIPRDRKILINNKNEYQLPSVYKKIKQLKDTTYSEYWTLFLFESLTLRALEKLCFGMDKNTFITDTNLINELKKKFKNFFITNKRGRQNLKRKDQFLEDGKELIKFYQAVLSLEETKKMILVEEYLPNEITKENICDGEFESLRDFQIALEKTCYIRQEIKISDHKKEELENKYGANVYQITSYDLFEKRKSEKEHTKIWKKFWKQDKNSGYTTRLNPQFSISYVEKREDSIKDKSGNEVERNRRKQAEYILSTTISENNDKPKFDMAFADKDRIKQNIEDFNKEFNKKAKSDLYSLYYYGIDRGQEELLTLGLFKFENQDITFTHPSDSSKSGTYKKPLPVDLEVWELPKGKLLEVVPYETKNGTKFTEAYKSISYAEKAGILEKKIISSCIDLTSAKLVNGKIVLNGDVSTLINLKLENAKRKILEIVNSLALVKKNKKGIMPAKIIFREKNKSNPERFVVNINVDGETIEKNIYFPSSNFFDFEKGQVEDGLNKILNESLQKIKEQGYCSINIPITKINHLRDAICANAVGILNFLQQKYFGIISFEDLPIDGGGSKNEHFSQNNANLGSRIEFMLLNKFKTLGLVPPNYKMVMSMQSKKEIEQLGIITYIKTEGTSSNCPHCSQGIDKKTQREHKWKHHKFKCCNNGKSCGFNTYSQEEIDKNKSSDKWNFTADKKGLDFLNSSDDVATYNIAKRGLQFIKSSNSKDKTS